MDGPNKANNLALTQPLPAAPAAMREAAGDGQYGGFYALPDEDVLRVWAAGVEETRELLERGWSSRES